MTHQANRTLDIELLALDLTTCGRCTGTDRNLTESIDAVADLLRHTGAEVKVTRHVVNTAEEAEKLRFVASPTIRVNGRDIAMEFKESSCKDCGDLCGCNGGVDCRVWIWQGQEYLEAPKAMIVDALLNAYTANQVSREQEPYTMPRNLRQFFAAKSTLSRAADPAGAEVKVEECCDRTSCCELSAKPACCDDNSTGYGVPATTACGCH